LEIWNTHVDSQLVEFRKEASRKEGAINTYKSHPRVVLEDDDYELQAGIDRLLRGGLG